MVGMVLVNLLFENRILAALERSPMQVGMELVNELVFMNKLTTELRPHKVVGREPPRELA